LLENERGKKKQSAVAPLARYVAASVIAISKTEREKNVTRPERHIPAVKKREGKDSVITPRRVRARDHPSRAYVTSACPEQPSFVSFEPSVRGGGGRG
jgi:predicted Zn-ribbon and HTH transcriptional regulator